MKPFLIRSNPFKQNLPPLEMTVRSQLEDPTVSALVHEPGQNQKGYAALYFNHTINDFVCEEPTRSGKKLEHFVPADVEDLKNQILQRIHKLAQRQGVKPRHIVFLAVDGAGEKVTPGLELPSYWRDPEILRKIKQNADVQKTRDDGVQALPLCVEGDKQIKLKHPRRARQVFQAARHWAPWLFWPYLGLAEADMLDGRVAEADALLDQARKILPQAPFSEPEKENFSHRLEEDARAIGEWRAARVDHLRRLALRPALPASSSLEAAAPRVDMDVSLEPSSLSGGFPGTEDKRYLNAPHLQVSDAAEKLLRKFHFRHAEPQCRSQTCEETANVLFRFEGSIRADEEAAQALEQDVVINGTTRLEHPGLSRDWSTLLFDPEPLYRPVAPLPPPDLNAAYQGAAEALRERAAGEWNERLRSAPGDHQVQVALRLLECIVVYQPWVRVTFALKGREDVLTRPFFWDPVLKEFAEAACEQCRALSRRFALKEHQLLCDACAGY